MELTINEWLCEMETRYHMTDNAMSKEYYKGKIDLLNDIKHGYVKIKEENKCQKK